MDPTHLFVGLPTFQRPGMLRRTLASVMAQTHPHMTVLVADDASGDETEQVVREAMAKDPRIRYHRHPENVGAVANFQFIIDQADAPYFLWLSDDDVLEPDFARRLIAELEREPGAVLAACDYRVIDEDYRTIGSWSMTHIHPTTPWAEGQLDFWSYPYTRSANLVHGIHRTEVLRSVRKPFYNTRKRLVVGHEVPLLAQVAMRGRIVAVPECLFSRMAHFNDGSSLNQQISGQAPLRDLVRLYAAIYARLVAYALRARVPVRQRTRLLGATLRSAARKGLSRLRGVPGPAPGTVPDELGLLREGAA